MKHFYFRYTEGLRLFLENEIPGTAIRAYLFEALYYTDE